MRDILTSLCKLSFYYDNKIKKLHYIGDKRCNIFYTFCNYVCLSICLWLPPVEKRQRHYHLSNFHINRAPKLIQKTENLDIKSYWQRFVILPRHARMMSEGKMGTNVIFDGWSNGLASYCLLKLISFCVYTRQYKSCSLRW